MNSIAFIDTEIEPKSGKVFEIGSIKDNGDTFHSNSLGDFIKFFSPVGVFTASATDNKTTSVKPRR